MWKYKYVFSSSLLLSLEERRETPIANHTGNTHTRKRGEERRGEERDTQPGD